MRTSLVVLALLAPSVAAAQASLPEQVAPPAATYKPVTELDFREQAVTATGVGPSIVLGQERTPAPHGSFIVLRANFNPEINGTIGEIR